jgi:hypothetical protein
MMQAQRALSFCIQYALRRSGLPACFATSLVDALGYFYAQHHQRDTVVKASHVSSGVYINARFRAGSRN